MVFRTLEAFIVLLIMTRLMGRKLLSQLTFFNYITGLALGSIAANIASQTNIHYLNGLTSLLAWAISTILVGYIGLKSSPTRVAVDGQPVVVIKQEKILEDKLWLKTDDLSMLLRVQKVLTVTPSYIPMELFSDGKVVEKNFKEVGMSLEWLEKQLSFSNFIPEGTFYVEL